jgi:two-component system chemotaxis response regulator CheY
MSEVTRSSQGRGKDDEKSKKRSQTVNIAVVDDSDFSRKRIIQTLESKDFHVVGEASNAQELMEIMQRQTVQILIIDVVMPEVSGIDLAKHVREHFRDTLIIMVSSLSLDHVILDAISAGANDFITKPFSSDELITSVQKLVDLTTNNSENA